MFPSEVFQSFRSWPSSSVNIFFTVGHLVHDFCQYCSKASSLI